MECLFSASAALVPQFVGFDFIAVSKASVGPQRGNADNFLFIYRNYNLSLGCVSVVNVRKTAEKVHPKIQKGLFLFAVSNSCADPIVYGE